MQTLLETEPESFVSQDQTEPKPYLLLGAEAEDVDQTEPEPYLLLGAEAEGVDQTAVDKDQG